jgi:hypothetical protein
VADAREIRPGRFPLPDIGIGTLRTVFSLSTLRPPEGHCATRSTSPTLLCAADLEMGGSG